MINITRMKSEEDEKFMRTMTTRRPE